jgi:glycosyl hydrolase family 12/cellulose binding protein with CBM2 domain
MTRHTRAVALTAAAMLAAGGFLALVLPVTGSQAATSTLCASQTAPVGGGTYTVQNNEWNSSASECVTTDGGADFTVANSSISNATNGAPGGYPSIYQGCHWGNCSSGGLTATPVQVANLTTGKVTTSWSTTQPGGSNVYDVAYDIWFNQTSTTNTQPNGTELMVWLNHNGGIQPFGSQVASNVSIGGHTYNVWFGQQSTWDTVSYVMTTGTTSVSNLDIGQLTQDMVNRGYTKTSWFLIDVEAGFELWQGGAGLATNSFSVTVNGSPPPSSPPPSSPPPSSPPPSSPPPGGSSCHVAYSLVNSWQGGFQAQAVISNTGGTTINGWTLAWTFPAPGDQKINNLWNGSYTQTGESVTVRNASYNAVIAPGGTATIGFTATDTSNTTPTSFTLNGTACQ